jgi:hypothetical protein
MLRRLAGAGLWLSLAFPAAVSAQSFVAASVNHEGGIFFGRGVSAKEAQDAAYSACRRVSSTCNTNPGATGMLDDVFAFMCCTQPSLYCGASPHENKAAAERTVRALFKPGASGCQVRGFYSALTGARLP